MPGCAAVGCNNRSEKGYIMKCFPRDPELRKIWQERVARADWVPSNNSFLCHVHFEADEWCVTDNGRVRLKKNAVPSIFNVTSTRKSPKKRTKLIEMNNGNEYENDKPIIYLENDTEYSSTGHLEEKDSDSQDNLSVQPFMCQRVYRSPKVIGNKKIFYNRFKEDITNSQEENIIIISDNDQETQSIKKFEKQEDGGEIQNGQSIDNFIPKDNLIKNWNENIIKTEVKREIDQISFNDSYDEIEEKLKQICDGYREENKSNNAEKLNLISRNEEEASHHNIINYKYSLQNEIENITNDTDVEIIFGIENGEECTRISKSAPFNNDATNEINKLDQHIINLDNNSNKEINQVSFTDINETFNKEKIHVSSNMRAAMKRKQKTREEVMMSIKKSIRDTSPQDTNSISNSDISDNIIELEKILRKEQNISNSMQFDNCIDTKSVTRYTIKVTGDPDDVCDIMQDLFKDIGDIQEYNNAYADKKNNAFVTSVITIDDYSAEAAAKDNDNDIFPAKVKNIMSKDNDQTLSCLLNLKNSQYLNTKQTLHSDEEFNDLNENNNHLASEIKNYSRDNYIIVHKYEKLQRKLKMQEDVITRLINQLTSHKVAEKDLRNKSLALEKKVESLMYEHNTKAGGVSSSSPKKRENMNFEQRLIEDLTNRLNYFEEANKKLVKSVATESQQRKKFESQLKQRDSRIKELNWKLEKASKFLERAEKNTNTYRRKMLNMQTHIRRKKLLEDKLSKFNEMKLTDSTNQGYSKKALSMAMEIKETCGTIGYKKLLDFGFPLPAFSALRTFSNNDFSDSNESNEILRVIPSSRNANEEHNNSRSKSIEKINNTNEKIELDDTEIVIGTVQDIFEENNDGDDFSTNELSEHFILLLQTM